MEWPAAAAAAASEYNYTYLAYAIISSSSPLTVNQAGLPLFMTAHIDRHRMMRVFHAVCGVMQPRQQSPQPDGLFTICSTTPVCVALLHPHHRL